MTTDKSSNINALDEWKEARSTISRFDENLDGLRKYGFTVVAGLLAVDTIQSYIKFENPTKSGLIVITIAFIVSLHMLDVYYQRIIEAASIRAKIIESTILNIELDNLISDIFELGKLSNYIRYIYTGFIVVAVLIGVVVVITAAPSPLTATLGNSSTNSTLIYSSINTTLANSSNPPSTSVDFSDPSTTQINSNTTIIENSGTLLTTLENTNNVSTYVINSNNRSTTVISSNNSSMASVYPKTKLIIPENLVQTIFSSIIIISVILILLNYVKRKNLDNQSNRVDEVKNTSDKILEIIEFIESVIPPTISFMTLIIIGFIAVASYLFPDFNLRFTQIYIFLIILAGVIGEFFIEYSSRNICVAQENWSLDKLECKRGEDVNIIFTNLTNKNKTFFRMNNPVCSIIPPAQNLKDSEFNNINADSDVVISPLNNYPWVWHTTHLQEGGIYRIKPHGWKYPLRCSVFVHVDRDEDKQRWVSERAYYLSRENPNNSREHNWYLAEEEFDWLFPN